MTVTSKQAWIQAGLHQLREAGFLAISGEKLARRLDVTRGSFYHHFKSMDEYVEHLLDEWEQSHTLDKIRQAKDLNPQQEMIQLMEQAWNADLQLEVAVRQWGFTHPGVQKRIGKVDKLRLDHISNLYGLLVDDPERGRQLGTIAYYGLLGALHASPRPTKTGLRDLIMEIQTLLLSGHWPKTSANPL